MTTEEINPPSVLDHLPPSLKCRDCKSCVAFQMDSGLLQTYCAEMHVITFESLKPANLLTECSRHQVITPEA